MVLLLDLLHELGDSFGGCVTDRVRAFFVEPADFFQPVGDLRVDFLQPFA